MTEDQSTETGAEYEAPQIEDVNDGGTPLAAIPGEGNQSFQEG